MNSEQGWVKLVGLAVSPVMLGMASVAMAAMVSPAAADESDAVKEFKAMSGYLAGLKEFSFDYDANLEIVTPDFQKLGFASSGSATVNRPDKVRLSRVGGFVDAVLAYDGKTLGIYGKNLNKYSKLSMTGSIDDVVENLRADFGLELPAADLFSADPAKLMLSNVTDSKYLGGGVINGKMCDHLAFRTDVTDWEIWVAETEQPLPCRLSITSKMMAQAPTYSVVFSNWNIGKTAAGEKFQIEPPASAKEVKITDMSGIDELPDLSSK